MLSIKAIGESKTEVSYYGALGRGENQDYYSEGGSRPGIFFGPGANALGLIGEVQESVLKNLLEGLSPDGQKRLVQKRAGTIVRRAGFDLTFSLPKSVSVAWVTADRTTREEIDRRAQAALEKTLDVIQELCGVARRGKDGLIQESAKLVFAIFSHDTARGLPGHLPDVNRHFHCVLPNLVVREDGTTGALDARPLFTRRMKMALGSLFRVRTRAKLSVGIASVN
ncbi:MAG: relaxase domain-containing protein [Planctomycetales bacterium]|nr:relaxase domain-containing protein [Planctomycetales bacterium]